MNSSEHVRLALRALAINKLRSALTMLGIIIGVGAVITLLSVGQGVQNLVTEQLQSIGTNLLFVMPGNLSATQTTVSMGSSMGSLTLADAEAIADPLNIPDMAQVAPELMASGEVSYRRDTINVSVSGVTASYESVRNFPVAFGDFISIDDENSAGRVAVIGSKVWESLFGADVYPVGETIKINGIPFKVIGVLQSKGGSGGGTSEDEMVLVPLSTAHERLFPRYHNQHGDPLVTVIYVQVVNEESMSAASDQIANLLRDRHNIQFQDEDDFTVINQQDLLSIFGEITGVLTIFLGAIAGISLLVGGIGIMNIMLVSVTERTREIGLRKAVGAKRRDILNQFLIESVIMSVIGGILGIGVGSLGAMIVSNLASGLNATVTFQSVALATGFSAAVGLFFGIYPATRAARLNPIDALRYE